MSIFFLYSKNHLFLKQSQLKFLPKKNTLDIPLLFSEMNCLMTKDTTLLL